MQDNPLLDRDDTELGIAVQLKQSAFEFDEHPSLLSSTRGSCDNVLYDSLQPTNAAMVNSSVSHQYDPLQGNISVRRQHSDQSTNDDETDPWRSVQRFKLADRRYDAFGGSATSTTLTRQRFGYENPNLPSSRLSAAPSAPASFLRQVSGVWSSSATSCYTDSGDQQRISLEAALDALEQADSAVQAAREAITSALQKIHRSSEPEPCEGESQATSTTQHRQRSSSQSCGQQLSPQEASVLDEAKCHQHVRSTATSASEILPSGVTEPAMFGTRAPYPELQLGESKMSPQNSATLSHRKESPIPNAFDAISTEPGHQKRDNFIRISAPSRIVMPPLDASDLQTGLGVSHWSVTPSEEDGESSPSLFPNVQQSSHAETFDESIRLVEIEIPTASTDSTARIRGEGDSSAFSHTHSFLERISEEIEQAEICSQLDSGGSASIHGCSTPKDLVVTPVKYLSGLQRRIECSQSGQSTSALMERKDTISVWTPDWSTADQIVVPDSPCGMRQTNASVDCPSPESALSLKAGRTEAGVLLADSEADLPPAPVNLKQIRRLSSGTGKRTSLIDIEADGFFVPTFGVELSGAKKGLTTTLASASEDSCGDADGEIGRCDLNDFCTQAPVRPPRPSLTIDIPLTLNVRPAHAVAVQDDAASPEQEEKLDETRGNGQMCSLNQRGSSATLQHSLLQSTAELQGPPSSPVSASVGPGRRLERRLSLTKLRDLRIVPFKGVRRRSHHLVNSTDSAADPWSEWNHEKKKSQARRRSSHDIACGPPKLDGSFVSPLHHRRLSGQSKPEAVGPEQRPWKPDVFSMRRWTRSNISLSALRNNFGRSVVSLDEHSGERQSNSPPDGNNGGIDLRAKANEDDSASGSEGDVIEELLPLSSPWPTFEERDPAMLSTAHHTSSHQLSWTPQYFGDRHVVRHRSLELCRQPSICGTSKSGAECEYDRTSFHSSYADGVLQGDGDAGITDDCTGGISHVDQVRREQPRRASKDERLSVLFSLPATIEKADDIDYLGYDDQQMHEGLPSSFDVANERKFSRVERIADRDKNSHSATLTAPRRAQLQNDLVRETPSPSQARHTHWPEHLFVGNEATPQPAAEAARRARISAKASYDSVSDRVESSSPSTGLLTGWATLSRFGVNIAPIAARRKDGNGKPKQSKLQVSVADSTPSPSDGLYGQSLPPLAPSSPFLCEHRSSNERPRSLNLSENTKRSPLASRRSEDRFDSGTLQSCEAMGQPISHSGHSFAALSSRRSFSTMRSMLLE